MGTRSLRLRTSVLKSNFKIEILVLTLFFDTDFISRQTSLLRCLSECCLHVVVLETSGNAESDVTLRTLCSNVTPFPTRRAHATPQSRIRDSRPVMSSGLL
jgi:hypothetical protein